MNSLTKSKVIAYLAVIFVAGGATGAVITFKSTHSRDVQAPSMEKTCNRLQDRLASRLNLSSEQISKLQPVFDETAEALRAVHSNALCDTDRILRRAHEKIARELTPEQQAKLEMFDSKRTEWLKRHLKSEVRNLETERKSKSEGSRMSEAEGARREE